MQSSGKKTLTAGKPKQVSTNPLGRFRDEVVGEVKNVVKDTAKQVAQEPKKILESILGKPSTGDAKSADAAQGIEDLITSGGQDPVKQAQAVKKKQLMQKKQADDQQKKNKLLRLHRQRLEEEKKYYEMKKKRQEQQEEQEKQQEEQEEQSEVVQLQREKQKSEQLTRQVAGRQGSREQGRGKKY